MKQKLEQSLNDLLQRQFGLTQYALLTPTEAQFGDYTTTIAWQLAKSEGGDAWHYAQVLAKNLAFISGVEVTVFAPGYLNFRYLPAFWVAEMRDLLRLRVSIEPLHIQDQGIRYAYERNALVLSHLTLPHRFVWPKARWQDPAHVCLLLLVKYRDYFSDLSSSKKTKDALNYLKNLARTIHYLYNEVTLVTFDAQKDQGLAAVLQASQYVIAQGINLAGGN